MGWTNKGKFRILNSFFRAQDTPSSTYIALVTAAVTPTVDINTLSQLTEITAGNGYVSGGKAITRDTTDWDVITENDTNDRAELQAADVTWTATGGSIPASGDGARYAVLTDNNGTVGSREVLAWWDLQSPMSVSNGQTLTLQNCELRLTE